MLTEHLSSKEKDFLIYTDKSKMDTLDQEMNQIMEDINQKLDNYEKTISTDKEPQSWPQSEPINLLLCPCHSYGRFR